MKKIFTASFTLFLLVLQSYSQRIEELEYVLTQSVSVEYESYNLKAHILSENKKVKINDDYYYSWYKSGKVKTTRGGYTGKLLHGECIEYFLDKSLKAKGNYLYGLKDGVWKHWYANGEYKRTEEWKAGKLIGEYKEYNEAGVLITLGKYKDGKLHGKQSTFDEEGILIKETYYKEGQPIKANEFNVEEEEKEEKKRNKKKSRKERRQEKGFFAD